MYPTVVERELELKLVLSPERSIAVPARLSYTSDDPFAVHITFHINSEHPVNWTFARELLGEEVQGRFADLKLAQAERCAKALGTQIKAAEVQFHHEVTNQYLWNQF